jgi:U4/U6.U5 tri-snRNP-associated protein 3
MCYQISTFLQPLNYATDRRDYGRDRDEDKRDRDPRDSRRRDERDRRDAPRRDGEKERDRHERDKRDGEKSRAAEHEAEGVTERGARVDSESRETVKASQSHGTSLFVLIPLINN